MALSAREYNNITHAALAKQAISHRLLYRDAQMTLSWPRTIHGACVQVYTGESQPALSEPVGVGHSDDNAIVLSGAILLVRLLRVYL